MIDNFAIGLTHLLLALAALRLVMRADLDRDPVGADDPSAGTPDINGPGQLPRRQMEVRRG